MDVKRWMKRDQGDIWIMNYDEFMKFAICFISFLGGGTGVVVE